MKDKKKVILASSIILGSLVLILGISYAVLSYTKTGENNELIVGDIYMHYKETNELVISDAMPTNINDYYVYEVNTIMKTQEVEDNELDRCVDYFFGFPAFDEGITEEKFCQGIGTIEGKTFQEQIDDGIFSSEESIQELLDKNIIVQNGNSYIVNPVMTNQTVVDNELSRCINIYENMGYEFDEGTTAESFCKGEGTAYNGITIQEDIHNWMEDSVEYGYDFLESIEELLNAGVIIHRIENLPYLEFTISGKNTYAKEDIWYEIVLNHGADHETRTERIRDALLRFTLVEVVADENVKLLLNNNKYSDLSNRRIWVETINKNTTEEINKTYRLYMVIDESVVIGNNDQDYTIDEWEDVYASIKVNVSGDFNEKLVVTDANCFTTRAITAYIHNENMTEEELNLCVNYLTNATSINNFLGEGLTMESFCQGIATAYEGMDFQDYLNLSFNNETLNYLVENNIAIAKNGLEIDEYDRSCGKDVVIPQNINNEKVISIGGHAFWGSGLESIVIPNGIIYIKSNSFKTNDLTTISIPSTVIAIYQNAFSQNRIQNIDFEEGVKVIGGGAFYGNNISNVTLPRSVKKYYCDTFDSYTTVTNPLNLVCYHGCYGFNSYSNCST